MENEIEKWNYIKLIGKMSDVTNSSYLLDLMDRYNVRNLQPITYEQVKEYYEEIKEKNL